MQSNQVFISYFWIIFSSNQIRLSQIRFDRDSGLSSDENVFSSFYLLLLLLYWYWKRCFILNPSDGPAVLPQTTVCHLGRVYVGCQRWRRRLDVSILSRSWNHAIYCVSPTVAMETSWGTEHAHVLILLKYFYFVLSYNISKFT